MKGKNKGKIRGHSDVAKDEPCRLVSREDDRSGSQTAGQKAYINWLAAASASRRPEKTSS